MPRSDDHVNGTSFQPPFTNLHPIIHDRDNRDEAGWLD